MDLNPKVGMSPELDAELAERLAAKADAEARKQLYDMVIDDDVFWLPKSDTESFSGKQLARLDLKKLDARARALPSGAFIQEAVKAVGVLRVRATALVELAIELDAYRLTHHLSGYDHYITHTTLGMTEDSSLADEVVTLAAASHALVNAAAELGRRIRLEQLRRDSDAELGWWARREARREAARQLAKEMHVYLEALADLPDADDVTLTAEQIVSARRDAASEAFAIGQTA